MNWLKKHFRTMPDLPLLATPLIAIWIHSTFFNGPPLTATIVLRLLALTAFAAFLLIYMRSKGWRK